MDEVSFLLGGDTASYPKRTDTGLKMVNLTNKLVCDIKYSVDLTEGHDFYSIIIAVWCTCNAI